MEDKTRQRLRRMLSHKPAFIGLLVILLTSYATACYSADRHYIIKNPANTSIAIFVHGFRGEYIATWGKLPELLQKDTALDSYDFLFWGYPSKFFGANEKIGTTGQHLKTEIDFLPKAYDRVILIGHSMGGLVIRSYIVQALLDGQGNDLKSIVDVIFFGTPNEGLGRAEAIPKIVNDQIADLGLASDFIVTLRKYWVQRVISAQRSDEYNRQIPTLAVAGYTDNFVPKESVNSFFIDTAITDGDHTSMVKPESTEHLTYRIIRTRLLRAMGTNSMVARGGISPEVPEEKKPPIQPSIVLPTVQTVQDDTRGVDNPVASTAGKASDTAPSPSTPWIKVTKSTLNIQRPSLSDEFQMKNVREKPVQWFLKDFPNNIVSLHGHAMQGTLESNVWSDQLQVRGHSEHIISQTTKEHVFFIVVDYDNLSSTQEKLKVITDDPKDLRKWFFDSINSPSPR